MRLGLRYIVMNSEYTGDLDPIQELLPTRITKPGVKPGMKSKWVNSKEILSVYCRKPALSSKVLQECLNSKSSNSYPQLIKYLDWRKMSI